jgi:DNA-binding CsgD family transcriptional regulator
VPDSPPIDSLVSCDVSSDPVKICRATIYQYCQRNESHMSADDALILRCLPAPVLRFSISSRLAILGRSSKCECVVDDRSISRRHAQLRAKNGELQVVDLESRNGTFFDEERIQTCQVKPSQIILFGAVKFQVEIADSSGELETDGPGTFKGKLRPRHPVEDQLTEGQQRVLQLILLGLPEKGIAKQLHRSEHTVHTHTRAILDKFRVHSRLELIVKITHAGE